MIPSALVSIFFGIAIPTYSYNNFQLFLSRPQSAETQCWKRRTIWWYVRTLYVNCIHNQRYCFAHRAMYCTVLQIGNSQCLFKFQDVVRLIDTHY